MLKIIGKAEQKKIDLQIETLEKKVSDLDAKLKDAKAKNKDLDTLAKELKAKTSELQSSLEVAEKESVQRAAEISQANQENELLLSQLMQVQEELERIFIDKKQLEVTAANLNSELASARAELVKVQQDLSQAQQSILNEQQAKQVAEAALAEIKAKTPAELKAVTDKYQQQAQVAQALEADLAKHKSELEQAHHVAANVKAELAQAQQAKLELDTLQTKTLSELHQLQKVLTEQTEQQAAKLKDATQENELLLTQLMQVQEELESYYLDKTKFEKLYQDMQARWVRLEKRYPNYVDFGSVELVAFDNLSEVPSITWRIKDYAQGGMAFDEFLFQTVLQDGQPGIGIVSNANTTASAGSALVPKLLKPQSKELEYFVRMGQSEFRQLLAATTVLTQLEAASWRGVDLPKDFDLAFWRQSLKLLPSQIQALPVLLRYDSVKLKRELVNPDYEHLWLEFKGLGLGLRAWPKFEIRLGAAMVQRGGFSQFPKFEIPLIDGKTKPFDSWYAESQDDNGAKLELRFSLEKQVFDTSVWAKLEDPDKALLMRLIYAMPEVLLRLEAEHAAIHRPWATWVGFAKAAVQVIEASRAAAQPKELPAAQPKALPASTGVAKLPAPSKKAATKPTAKKAPVAAKKASSEKKALAAAKKVLLAKKTSAKKVAAVTKKTVDTKPTAKKFTPVKPMVVPKKAAVAKKNAVVKKAPAAKKTVRKK
jgi:hypothetical protein